MYIIIFLDNLWNIRVFAFRYPEHTSHRAVYQHLYMLASEQRLHYCLFTIPTKEGENIRYTSNHIINDSFTALNLLENSHTDRTILGLCNAAGLFERYTNLERDHLVASMTLTHELHTRNSILSTKAEINSILLHYIYISKGTSRCFAKPSNAVNILTQHFTHLSFPEP